MNRFDNRLFWGILLVVGGILFLLQNLGVFLINNLVWAILLGVIGLGFLYVVITDRRRWWAIIPGLILVYLALLIILDQLVPAFSNNYGGPLFLAIIGLSFWLVYILNRSYWWAIIPGGVMLTLAVVAGTSRFLSGIETGGIFFLGLGLTFALLALVVTPAGRMHWPLIPAAVLILMGALISSNSTTIFRFIWPVALILGGLYLFFLRFPAHR